MRQGQEWELQTAPGRAVWINGEKVGRQVLEPGDLIELGQGGPVVRFRTYDSGWTGHKAISEAFEDCVDCVRYAKSFRGRPANLPLGAFADTAYDQELTRLAPGDRLFLYTDGLIEAPDLNGEFFGQERLQAALEEASGEDLVGLKEVVGEILRQHTGGSLAHDDVTFMALEARQEH